MRLGEEKVVQLRPGMQLMSAISQASIIVIRAPKADVEVRCGGVAMVGVKSLAPETVAAVDDGDGPVLGKRYMLESLDLECLCTRGGPGALTANGEPLILKEAKPLPSSD
jgi:hypothetical protein